MATTNNFLPFAGGGAANVISQATYAGLAALTNGFSAGVAASNQLNKVWRQSSIMSAVLAQLICDESGADALDDGTTATLLSNLKLGLLPIRQQVTATVGGTADAITATFTNPPTAYLTGIPYYIRAASPNATTTPTFTPNSGILAAKTIVKGNNAPLAVGDISGAGHWLTLQYDATLDKIVLLNPANGVVGTSGNPNLVVNSNFQINQDAYVSGAATIAGQYVFDQWKVTGVGGVTFATVNNKTTVTIPAAQTMQQPMAGVNLQSGTHVLTWEGTAQGRIGAGAYGASGAVAAVLTGGTDTTIEFNTGTVANVKLEQATTPTVYVAPSERQNMFDCQWFYERGSFYVHAATSAGGVIGGTICYKNTKRASPTVSGVLTTGGVLQLNLYVTDVLNQLEFTAQPIANGQIVGTFIANSRF